MRIESAFAVERNAIDEYVRSRFNFRQLSNRSIHNGLIFAEKCKRAIRIDLYSRLSRSIAIIHSETGQL